MAGAGDIRLQVCVITRLRSQTARSRLKKTQNRLLKRNGINVRPFLGGRVEQIEGPLSVSLSA
jgi:hypothetical protein